MIAVTASTSKVGDTLTVTVEDEDGNEVDLTNADIQWFAGNEEIDGADDDTLVVGDELIGLQIFVEVTDAEGKVYESEATAPVYAALALLSADQTGKSVVTLTTNGPVTAADDIDVLKGTKEVEIDSIDYEDDGAVVTLKNAIVADAEYTVTLTPADEDDEATTATFTGEKAKLDRIEFLNNVLVMKDNTYKEGYAYAKGYDQFDDEVLLSGLTVTPGVGDFKSYDNATGKITLVDNTPGTTGAFLLIKEVPVFVQYQSGNDIISAQALLTVSNQAYVDELEFGDVAKDGTMRDDERLTMDELGSGKYYVEIEEVKDQYGNPLSAQDLNDQKDGKNNGNKTLFVIPGTSGAFYQTGDFAELNGKTILWLEPVAAGAGKPGTMNLTITGAGGKTFTKEITVDDNPYIDVLNVTYPELYSGSEKSAALEFSAVDQYGEAIDLWDFRPEIDGTVAGSQGIKFGDKNNLTVSSTTIKMSAGKFNTIVKDAGKKTFTVTLNMDGVDSKTLVTFTEQTAGMKVKTQSVMVGEVGTAARIKSALKSGANTQLVNGNRGSNKEINFNKFIQFEDANGNEMIRGVSEKYPKYYELRAGDTVSETLPPSTNAIWKNGSYVWTLTQAQVNAAANLAAAPAKYSKGVVTYANMGGAATLDVYATIYLKSGTTYYKLDEKKFHLTSVQGKDKSYTAKAANTIYCNKDDGKTTEIKVTAKTDSGETYEIAKTRVQVVPKAPFSVTTDNRYTVSGADASGTGTTTATVYVTEWDYDNDQAGTTINEETTVDISYSDAAPVATKVEKKFAIDGEDTNGGPDYTTISGTGESLVGKEFDGDFTADSFKLGANANLTVDKGVLTVTEANSVEDTLTFRIADQYGRAMDSTKFYVDGVKVTANVNINGTKDTTIEWANGTLSGKVILEAGGASKTLTYVPAATSQTVMTKASLKAALASDVDEVVIGKDIDLTTAEIGTAGVYDIPAGKKVTIPADVTVTITGDNNDDVWKNAGELVVTGSLITSKADINNSGTITVNGTWDHEKGTTKGNITNTGKVLGSGHVTIDGATITNTNGEFNVTGSTLVLVNTCSITGGEVGGHIAIASGANVTFGAATTIGGTLDIAGTVDTSAGVTVEDGTIVKLEAGANTTQMTGLKVAAGNSFTVETVSGNAVVVANETNAAINDVSLANGAAVSGTGITVEDDETKSGTLLQLGAVTGTNQKANNEALNAEIKNLWGVDAGVTDAANDVTFYLLMSGPKQGGLSAGSYYVTLTAQDAEGKDLDKETYGYDGQLAGTSPSAKSYVVTLKDANNGSFLYWTNTFNDELKKAIPAGTVLTANVYSDETLETEVDSISWTVTDDIVDAYAAQS